MLSKSSGRLSLSLPTFACTQSFAWVTPSSGSSTIRKHQSSRLSRPSSSRTALSWSTSPVRGGSLLDHPPLIKLDIQASSRTSSATLTKHYISLRRCTMRVTPGSLGQGTVLRMIVSSQSTPVESESDKDIKINSDIAHSFGKDHHWLG